MSDWRCTICEKVLGSIEACVEHTQDEHKTPSEADWVEFAQVYLHPVTGLVTQILRGRLRIPPHQPGTIKAQIT